MERKLELRAPTPDVNRGYSAKGTESLAYSLGAARPPDLFEAFNVGIDDNIWPDDLPRLRTAVERYLDELRPLVARIESIIECALDLAARLLRAAHRSLRRRASPRALRARGG